MSRSRAIAMLVDEKTDTELLNTLVMALIENENECLDRLTVSAYGEPSNDAIIAGAVIAGVCEAVKYRLISDESVEDDD